MTTTVVAVRERPILLGGLEVRATMSGLKTQLRRPIDCRCNWDHCGRLLGVWGLSVPPYRYDGVEDLWRWRGDRQPKAGDWIEQCQTDVDDHATYPVRCPFGEVGDRLWVKEKWASPEANKKIPGRVAYDADGKCGAWLGDGAGGLVYMHHGRVIESEGYKLCFPEEGDKTYGLGRYTDVRSGRYPSYKHGWRSSTHMPRWASRITLEITGIRVERLQEITEEGAIAEGVGPGYVPNSAGTTSCVGHRPMFVRTWNETYGDTCSWTANRWVWVVEFRRVGMAATWGWLSSPGSDEGGHS